MDSTVTDQASLSADARSAAVGGLHPESPKVVAAHHSRKHAIRWAIGLYCLVVIAVVIYTILNTHAAI